MVTIAQVRLVVPGSLTHINHQAMAAPVLVLEAQLVKANTGHTVLAVDNMVAVDNRALSTLYHREACLMDHQVREVMADRAATALAMARSEDMEDHHLDMDMTWVDP